MGETFTFRIVTYNAHSCRGLDRRVRPERIAAVLRETEADLIALQEVWSAEGHQRDKDQLGLIAAALGMEKSFGGNWHLNGGTYGNALLSRWPAQAAHNYDISWRGRERRGCLRADVPVNNAALLHVFNVHLGRAFRERRHQAHRLVSDEILNRAELSGPRLVLGDFNEWRPGLTTQLLAGQFRSADLRYHLRRARTYPGLLPMVHLDHIYYDPALELQRLRLHRSRAALIASDHLPLVADFQLQM